MSTSAIKKFKVVSDRLKKEQKQLTAVATNIHLQAMSSEKIRNDITDVITEVFGVLKSEIQGRSRKRPIVYARHTYCMLCHNLDPESTLEKTGKSIGRDHATILNSIRKCNNLRETDLKYSAMFQVCVDKLTDKVGEHDMSKVTMKPHQEEMKRGKLAAQLLDEFIIIWGGERLVGRYHENNQPLIEAFNDLKSRAVEYGF